MADEPSPDSLPKVGAIVDGKYEIVGVLGRGGMGVVFEANHLRMRQRVALKVLRPQVRDQPGARERFEREARAAGKLRGVHIARVLDVDTTASGLPYIVMEFLEGIDLGDELAVRGPLPVSEAVDHVLQACMAMREAHAAGIIHRDLKPANLFLCTTAEGPIVKILDFGISKITTEVDGRITAAAAAMGSPVYMSPEQLRAASDVDARTDVWSLGIILYELLAGRPPFGGAVTQAIASIVSDAPPALAGRRPDVPGDLERAIRRALEKYPSRRFADVVAFAQTIAPFGSTRGAEQLRAALAMPLEHVAGTASKRPSALAEGDRNAETVAAFRPAEGKETAPSWSTAAFASLRPRRRRWAFTVAALGAFVVTAALFGLKRTRHEPKAAATQPPSTEPTATATVRAVVPDPGASLEPSATPPPPSAPSSSPTSSAAAPARRRSPTTPRPAAPPSRPTANPLHL